MGVSYTGLLHRNRQEIGMITNKREIDHQNLVAHLEKSTAFKIRSSKLQIVQGWVHGVVEISGAFNENIEVWNNGTLLLPCGPFGMRPSLTELRDLGLTVADCDHGIKTSTLEKLGSNYYGFVRQKFNNFRSEIIVDPTGLIIKVLDNKNVFSTLYISSKNLYNLIDFHREYISLSINMGLLDKTFP